MRNLNANEKMNVKSIEKLSSGMRINQAGDDASGSAISEKMRAQVRGLQQAQRNIQDGISLIQTAESGLAKIIDPNMQRLRELSVQASNGTLTANDREAIQQEVNQILKGINDIANNTEFNGINLLNVPGIDSVTPPETIKGSSDIIFIIDRTGSMKSEIVRVEANIQDFASTLQSKGIDIRLGLVTYGDIVPSMGGDPINTVPFTNNVDEFKKSLSNIGGSIAGGVDREESGLEGIHVALGQSFRLEASKQFILVTDAPVHDNKTAADPDGGDGLSIYDIDDTAFEMKERGIKMTVVGPKSESDRANEQLKRLSGPTGGRYLEIEGNFSTQLQDLAIDIVKDSLKEENTDLYLQVGANSGEVFKVDLTDVRTTALGIDNMKVDPWEEAQKSISKIDEAIRQITGERSKFGAYQNSLEHINNNVMNFEENLAAAESRIRDVDMAKEVMNQTKSSILSQAAQAMLAQANKAPQQVLELLR